MFNSKWEGASPSKIIMPSSFNYQPNIIMSRKINTLLYIVRRSCIDNIHRVAFSGTRDQWKWQTGVIVEVIPVVTDRICWWKTAVAHSACTTGHVALLYVGWSEWQTAPGGGGCSRRPEIDSLRAAHADALGQPGEPADSLQERGDWPALTRFGS